uniref:hypothetical protein n=1 Tax=Gormaniella terricola TaxID=2904618 RepID=UPI0021CC8149|nr:hypothetical protein ODF01_pgp013 [Gormaniella terricola]UWV18293.1 hypothetical protein [Gormaniella terricola]
MNFKKKMFKQFQKYWDSSPLFKGFKPLISLSHSNRVPFSRFLPFKLTLPCKRPLNAYSGKSQPQREVVEASETLVEVPKNLHIVYDAEFYPVANQQRDENLIIKNSNPNTDVQHDFSVLNPAATKPNYFSTTDMFFAFLESEVDLKSTLRDTPFQGNYRKPAPVSLITYDIELVTEDVQSHKNTGDTSDVVPDSTLKKDSDVIVPNQKNTAGIEPEKVSTEESSVGEITETVSAAQSEKSVSTLTKKTGKQKVETFCQKIKNLEKIQKKHLKTLDSDANKLKAAQIDYQSAFENEIDTLNYEEKNQKEAATQAYSQRKKKTVKSAEALNKNLLKIEKSFEKKRSWVKKAYDSLISLCKKKISKIENRVKKTLLESELKEKASAKEAPPVSNPIRKRRETLVVPLIQEPKQSPSKEAPPVSNPIRKRRETLVGPLIQEQQQSYSKNFLESKDVSFFILAKKAKKKQRFQNPLTQRQLTSLVLLLEQKKKLSTEAAFVAIYLLFLGGIIDSNCPENFSVRVPIERNSNSTTLVTKSVLKYCFKKVTKSDNLEQLGNYLATEISQFAEKYRLDGDLYEKFERELSNFKEPLSLQEKAWLSSFNIQNEICEKKHPRVFKLIQNFKKI